MLDHAIEPRPRGVTRYRDAKDELCVRLVHTIGEGLIATLPHYTGGPRQANGKLYAQPAPLTLPQLQTRVLESPTLTTASIGTPVSAA